MYEIAYEEVVEDFEKVKKVLTEEAEKEALEQAAALGEVREKQIEIIDTAIGKDIVVKVTVQLELTEELQGEEPDSGQGI